MKEVEVRERQCEWELSSEELPESLGVDCRSWCYSLGDDVSMIERRGGVEQNVGWYK